jgi:putative SbcD/Mre11-related phosphoesterase
VSVEPIPDEQAALVETDGQRLLALADYHAGIETVLQSDGVELDSRADQRRDQVLDLLARTDPDRLVVVGDLVHAVGDPWRAERDELAALFDAVSVPVTLVKGNHDGQIEDVLREMDHPIETTDPGGTRFGEVGFAHGHTWPAGEVLAADILCTGHEHPVVRLEDEVGGGRAERVWLRGVLDSDAFVDRYDHTVDADLVVFPAFNDRSGGTWINVADDSFLSPFLPAGIDEGEAYLLDGTRLGDYRQV